MGDKATQSSTRGVVGSGFLGLSLVKLRQSAQTPVSIVDSRPSVASSEHYIARGLLSFNGFARSVNGGCLIPSGAVHRADLRPIALCDDARVRDDARVQGAVNLCNVVEESDISRTNVTRSVAVFRHPREGHTVSYAK